MPHSLKLQLQRLDHAPMRWEDVRWQAGDWVPARPPVLAAKRLPIDPTSPPPPLFVNVRDARLVLPAQRKAFVAVLSFLMANLSHADCCVGVPLPNGMDRPPDWLPSWFCGRLDNSRVEVPTPTAVLEATAAVHRDEHRDDDAPVCGAGVRVSAVTVDLQRCFRTAECTVLFDMAAQLPSGSVCQHCSQWRDSPYASFLTRQRKAQRKAEACDTLSLTSPDGKLSITVSDVRQLKNPKVVRVSTRDFRLPVVHVTMIPRCLYPQRLTDICEAMSLDVAERQGAVAGVAPDKSFADIHIGDATRDVWSTILARIVKHTTKVEDTQVRRAMEY